MKADDGQLLQELRGIVGRRHVLTGARATHSYRHGIRFGGGEAFAVVRPGTLLEQWRALKHCVEARKAVIMQAANTGLTAGSTPSDRPYDRDIVIINGLRLTRMHVINEGTRVLCLPGTTLYQLETELKRYGREPHSVIGSSCIGASVVGGLCNNSGGALVRRGPAYTELALFAQLDATRQLRLVNHLGIDLGLEPEAMLLAIERGQFDVDAPAGMEFRRASDSGYAQRVRELDADRPARFNEDPARLFEVSGCAGKVAIFAAVVDTFPKDKATSTFYVGTNQPQVLEDLRARILSSFKNLPVLAEYLHRDAFTIAERYGRSTYLAIKFLGTRHMARLFRLQSLWRRTLARTGLERLNPSRRGAKQRVSLAASHLPRRLRAFRDRYEHHLILKVADGGIAEASDCLRASLTGSSLDYFECTAQEADAALLHRFAVAGAANNYAYINRAQIADLMAFDAAFRPKDSSWTQFISRMSEPGVEMCLGYGHFLCHVFHLDYLVRRGTDTAALHERIKARLDDEGARYPAEHNLGHLYHAGPELVSFYRKLDPTNTFNPGIGMTSTFEDWDPRGAKSEDGNCAAIEAATRHC